jgi:hypothetical protein
MKSRIVLLTLLTLCISLAFFSSGLAQDTAQDSACTALIQTAFDHLNESCAVMPGNSACFGNSASATSANGGDVSFSKPGDQLDLSAIQSIQTMPLDAETEAWGLALLNVHANVPLALSEQGLKYLMVGDVNVENIVDASSAFTPVPSVTVTPLVAANLRSSPSTDARVLGNAPVGTELKADGTSADNGWLRVLNGEQMAWISRQVIGAKDGDLDGLPVIGSDTRTLMQSINLSTGNDVSTCTDAPPSMLVIQSPANMNASITVNGVDIRFDGTIALHVSPDNVMYLIVMSGGANMGGVSVPAGFSLNVPLSADGHTSGGAPTGLRPINDGERKFLTSAVQGISANLMYAALTVPTQEEVGALLAQLNLASVGQSVAGPASGQAECSKFKPTSPLSNMPLGVTPFYWDAAQGATAYRINLYSADGALVTTFDTGVTTTTFQIDTNAFGGGSNFSWSVDALVNGQVACSSGHVAVVRDLFPQFAGNTSGNPPQQNCQGGWNGC